MHGSQVQIANAEVSQTTSFRWQLSRQADGLEPAVAVEPLRMDEIERRKEQFDLICPVLLGTAGAIRRALSAAGREFLCLLRRFLLACDYSAVCGAFLDSEQAWSDDSVSQR